MGNKKKVYTKMHPSEFLINKPLLREANQKLKVFGQSEASRVSGQTEQAI